MKNLKICCINPPIRDFYTTTIRRQPLGLLYIIAVLRASGFTVTFVNGNSPKRHVLPLPEEFSYLKEFMHGTTTVSGFPFKQYCHFGLSFQEIEKQIKQASADVFMVSALFTPYYRETARIIEIIKRNNPDAVIIVGGHHAALYPEYFLKELGVTYVVTGEGEESSLLLVQCLEENKHPSSVPGIAWQEGGNVLLSKAASSLDIHQLPFPAREFLKPRDLKMYRKRAVSLIASRGCPNRCSFCTARIIWGEGYRVRSPEAVISEIDHCVKKYQAAIFNFEDDNLFASKEDGKHLLQALGEYQRLKKMELEFTAMNGISLEQVDEEVLEAMEYAGFGELNISLMSHGAGLQEKYRRPFSSDRFSRIAGKAVELGMNVRAYFILGLPEQTAEEVNETISFLQSLRVKIFPSVYYDVRAPRHQWKMQRSSAFFNETEHLNRHDLLMLFRKSIAGN